MLIAYTTEQVAYSRSPQRRDRAPLTIKRFLNASNFDLIMLAPFLTKLSSIERKFSRGKSHTQG